MDTTADKHVAAAREKVRGAIKELAHVVVDQCDGASDFKDVYLYKLRGAMNKLIDVREELG